MNQPHVREQLSPYLDRVLSDEETRQIEIHLHECTECSQVFQELQHMVAWLKTVPAPSPRMGLETRLIARLGEEEKKKRRNLSWISVSGGLATAMVAFVVFVMVRESRLDKMGSRAYFDQETSLKSKEMFAGKLASAPILSEKRIDEKTHSSIISGNKSKLKGIGDGIGYGGGSAGGYDQSAAIPLKIQNEMLVPGKAKLGMIDTIGARNAGVAAEKKEADKRLASSKPEGQVQLGSLQPLALKEMQEESPNNIRRGIAAPIRIPSEKTQLASAGSQLKAERESYDFVVGGKKEVLQDKTLQAHPLEQAGLTCRITNTEMLVIRNKKEWDDLRQQMGPVGSAPLFPSLDFSKQMVVAVFMGEEPSAGHAIHIVSEEFREKPGGRVLVVKVRRTYPPNNVAVATVLTQPYHLKVLPMFHGHVQFQDVK